MPIPVTLGEILLREDEARRYRRKTVAGKAFRVRRLWSNAREHG
jgi:hypothetical protein